MLTPNITLLKLFSCELPDDEIEWDKCDAKRISKCGNGIKKIHILKLMYTIKTHTCTSVAHLSKILLFSRSLQQNSGLLFQMYTQHRSQHKKPYIRIYEITARIKKEWKIKLKIRDAHNQSSSNDFLCLSQLRRYSPKKCLRNPEKGRWTTSFERGMSHRIYFGRFLIYKSVKN